MYSLAVRALKQISSFAGDDTFFFYFEVTDCLSDTGAVEVEC